MSKEQEFAKREEEFENFKKWIQPQLPFDISGQRLIDMSKTRKVGELTYGNPLPMPKGFITFINVGDTKK